jgi:[ribosomal protein S18]-alanine N-acetyltransferase
LSYYLRQMRKEDIPEATIIDREAFPTQWPPANFQNELKNQMAYFTVACDSEKTLTQEEGETRSPQKDGLGSKIRRFLGLGQPSDDDSGPFDNHYIVGLIGSWIMADEAHITTIAVREAYRRRGIGELLIISAIELALELHCTIVTLEVRITNTGAQQLYLKYGFTQVGLRKGYYTDNREDAMVMSTDKITSAGFQERFRKLKQDLTDRGLSIKTAIPQK